MHNTQEPNHKMKNLILTGALICASTLPAFGQEAGLPILELTAPQSAKAQAAGLPSFRGIAFKASSSPESLASQLLEAAAVREAGSLVKFTPSSDGSKLRYQGVMHPSTCLEINTLTGDISFQTDVKDMNAEASTPGLPSGTTAVRRALQHLRSTGLLPDNKRELFVQHVGGLRMASLNEAGQTREFAKVTTVHFGRRINGVNVGGPGSKIIVQLGEHGRLVGVSRRWMELKMEAHSSKDVLRDTEVGAAISLDLMSTHNTAKAIRAAQPSLGFYDDGAGRIEPAWFTQAQLEYADETIDAISVVSALRKSSADFVQCEPALVAPQEAEVEPISGQDD